MRWFRLQDLDWKLTWTYVRFERRKLMPKKFKNYVIKGQEHVDRKTGKTIPSPSAWRSVEDVLPETPVDDTACLYYVKLENSEKIIMLAYAGNGEWTDTEGKEYKGVETWLEYMPKEHPIVERKTFLNEDILKAIVSDYMEKTEGVTVNTNNVFFKVGRKSVGYGMSEHEELVFIGCDVIAIGEGN